MQSRSQVECWTMHPDSMTTWLTIFHEKRATQLHVQLCRLLKQQILVRDVHKF